jgi:hypothetical protein
MQNNILSFGQVVLRSESAPTDKQQCQGIGVLKSKMTLKHKNGSECKTLGAVFFVPYPQIPRIETVFTVPALFSQRGVLPSNERKDASWLLDLSEFWMQCQNFCLAG